MKSTMGAAWVAAAILAVPAFGQMEGPQPPDGPLVGLQRSHDRQDQRLIRNYDLNHDGRVTQDEMNRTLGARFAAATKHTSGMTVEQFIALHQPEFRQHAAEIFRRLDWDGNGKLTLAEYGQAQRVRFISMDDTGAGFVSCAQRQQVPSRDRKTPRGYNRSNYSLAGFCFDNDLNRDGTVTRTELDKAVAGRFSAASGGAGFMTVAQYTASEQEQFVASNNRTFQRLDKDGDGVLTIAEFAATPLRLFARLDRNHDRALSPDELQPRAPSRDDGNEGRQYAAN